MTRSPTAHGAHRREELLEVATLLFGRRGFHGTSMSDIAGAMGLQKASLYHWVESKEDLLYQVLSGVLDSLISQARVIAEDEGRDFEGRLRQLVTLHARYTVDHPDVMQVFLAESKWLAGARGREMRDVRRGYHRLYEDVFYKARDLGEIYVPKETVPVYINLLFSMTNNLPVWHKQGGFYSPAEIANLVCDLVLRNVQPYNER